MRALTEIQKQQMQAGAINNWTNVMGIGLVGQSINSVLSLINQIIYHNNPNPYYSRSSIYNDSASRLFVRAQQMPWKLTLSFGSPYL